MDKTEYNKLASRLKDGDRSAAGSIFDELAPQTYRFFYARTGQRETAEDLMQEVFLKVVKRIEQFDLNEGDFVPWFWKIAHNSLIDFFRVKKPLYLDDMTDKGFDIRDEKNHIMSNARMREVMNIVKSFSPEDQELFELHFLADLSYSDLAQVTGKSEANLRVMIHRLKQKILKND